VKQQKQTKQFFKGHASEWQLKAQDEVYSLINDRHRAVHKCLDNYVAGSRLLDVGCGTGQLAIEASARGYDAVGIDFADEMITIAKDNARKTNSSAKFEVASVFEYSNADPFDVISAMGFIEYISLSQLDEFFDFVNKHLKPRGSISVGSRNRLFNVATYNDYTKMEKGLSTIDSLIEEASLIISAREKSELILNLRKFRLNNDLIQNDTHPLTGIGVETRFQFTPSDLISRIEKHGFKVSNIYPVNYHTFNPVILSDEMLKNVGRQISELISAQQQLNFRLLTNSSSFVLEAMKCN